MSAAGCLSCLVAQEAAMKETDQAESGVKMFNGNVNTVVGLLSFHHLLRANLMEARRVHDSTHDLFGAPDPLTSVFHLENKKVLAGSAETLKLSGCDWVKKTTMWTKNYGMKFFHADTPCQKPPVFRTRGAFGHVS